MNTTPPSTHHATNTTRDYIIQKTCELIELQGYHATGLSQIIKASGTPKGSLYHYFPKGKEALVAESIRTVGQMVLDRMTGLLNEQTDPAAAMRGFIENICYNLERSGFGAGGPITTVAMEAAANSDLLRAECARIYAGWITVIEKRLTAAQIPSERAARLAMLTIAAIEGGIILARTYRQVAPLQTVAAEIGAMITAAQAHS